jgi:hypothetical protein
MEENMRRASQRILTLFALGALLLVSCSLPGLLTDQIRDIIQEDWLIQKTPEISPSEDPAEPGGTPAPTLQDAPVRVMDRTILERSDSPYYSIEGRWPNLSGPELVTAPFNLRADLLVGTVQEGFLAAVSETGQGFTGPGEYPLSSLEFDYEVAYEDGTIFSFFLRFNQYVALSVHPFPFSHALNYDVNQGDFMTLEALFLPGTDPIQEIGIRLDPMLASCDFGYEAGRAAEVMRQRENWNLLPGGLRVNFDVYEVGPYAAGPQSELIPWEALAGLIDPAGPAGQFSD